MLSLHCAINFCATRIIIDIEEERHVDDSMKNKWSEHVEDLWSQNKLKHLRDMALPAHASQISHVKGETYGFEKDHEKKERSKKQDNTLTDNDYRAAAEKVTSKDLSEYLYFLELDEEVVEMFLTYGVNGSMILEGLDIKDLKDMGFDMADCVKVKGNFKKWLGKKKAV